MLEGITLLLIAVVVICLAFDYVNGFHDAANAIATVVSTRAMTPRRAVMMAGVLNFAGAFWSSEVAKTMGSGLIEPAHVQRQQVILAALMGALVWNLLTWWWGLPSSSSHALVGGLIGAVAWQTGSLAVGVKWWGILTKVAIPAVVAPIVALMTGYFIMWVLMWLLFWMKPRHYIVNQRVRMMQQFSAALMAFSHGTADAQKVMGIITLALVTARLQTDFEVQPWVKFSCAVMIAMGTSAGGWKIIKTMGGKIFKLTPIHGFAADLTSSLVLQVTAHFGMPLSTTHVITGSIMGVGASKRVSAVRWGVAKNIAFAWVATIPAAATMSALSCAVVNLVFP